MIGAFISIALLAMFFAGFFIAFKTAGGIDILKRIDGAQWIMITAVMLLAIAFPGYMESKDKFIYFWDSLLYWQQSVNQAQSLFHSPFQAIRDLYASILNNDYNYLLPTLVAVPLKIFGYSHSVYICINAALWLVPSMLVTLTICMRITEIMNLQGSHALPIVSMCLIALFPSLYYALLFSYSDVGVLLPQSISLLMLIQWKPGVWNKSQLKYAVLLSCLLMTIVLFRRHFAFFVIGFGVAMIIKAIYWQLTDKKDDCKIMSSFIFIGAVVIFALLVLGVLFTKFLIHALFTNYSAAYVGYDAPLPDKIQSVISYFGISLFFCLIMSIIAFIKCRQVRLSWLLFLAISVITPALFFRVQVMGAQHIYNIVYPLFLFCYIGFAYCWKEAVDAQGRFLRITGIVACSIIFALNTINFAYAYSAYRFSWLSPLSSISSRIYSPMIREDFDQLHELADFVNAQEAKDGDKTVYVLSSGLSLNESLLRFINFPKDQNGIEGLQYTSDVDMRDGFPEGFLGADFIIVSDPINLHLATGTQEVVRYLAQELQEPSSEVGKHYSLIKTFQLEGDTTAKVYEKTSQYSESDLQELRDYFDDYYPGHNELFSDRIKINSE